MRENGETPIPETLLCGRCAATYDLEDNFCRQCGLSFTDERLPSVRNGRTLPVAWRPPLPVAVVKGAAFVVAGTLAEVFLRRLVRGAVRRGPWRVKTHARREPAQVEPHEASMPDDTQMVSETLLLRRVRFRR